MRLRQYEAKASARTRGLRCALVYFAVGGVKKHRVGFAASPVTVHPSGAAHGPITQPGEDGPSLHEEHQGYVKDKHNNANHEHPVHGRSEGQITDYAAAVSPRLAMNLDSRCTRPRRMLHATCGDNSSPPPAKEANLKGQGAGVTAASGPRFVGAASTLGFSAKDEVSFAFATFTAACLRARLFRFAARFESLRLSEGAAMAGALVVLSRLGLPAPRRFTRRERPLMPSPDAGSHAFAWESSVDFPAALWILVRDSSMFCMLFIVVIVVVVAYDSTPSSSRRARTFTGH